MGENLHNLIKISSLMFLSWRRDAKRPRPHASAGEIAQAAEPSKGSIYVLLSRWTKWDLVRRLPEAVPYQYYISPTGLRYLKNLPKWYDGNLKDIATTVSESCRMIIWWGKRRLGTKEGLYDQLYYISGPFQDTSDFVKVDMQGRQVSGIAADGCLVRYRTDTAYDACWKVKNLGIDPGKPMLQAIVDSGEAHWKKQEPVST